MNREDAARILEPLWIGILAAQVRVMEAAQKAETLQGMEAFSEIGHLQQAADWLTELARRFGSVDALHSMLELPDGSNVSWPVLPAAEARREAYGRYLATRPDAVKLLEGKDSSVVPFRKFRVSA